jgi:CRP/FNR family transcriptional regulator, anaerobic regulatory protein
MYLVENPESYPTYSATVTSINEAKVGGQKKCKHWSNLKEICNLLHISVPLNSSILSEEIYFQHVQVKAGNSVFRMGQPFKMLYIVNSGFLKSTMIDEHGNEQVLNFPMKSDLLCMDGIYSNRLTSEAIALTDCDLIILPFEQLALLGRSHVEMEGAIYRIMGRELIREQTMRVILGSSSAEARVTRFLLALSDKFSLLGYSSKIFNLRMSRQEIGSYLGLTLETISRTLSSLNSIGLIVVDRKSIELKDIDALRAFRKHLSINPYSKKEQSGMQKMMINSLLPLASRLKGQEICAAS